MRLFIAICFEAPVIDALMELEDELIEGGVQGRRTPPENLHLTLAFIGEYGNPDEVLDVMETVPFEPLTIRFGGFWHLKDMYLLRLEESAGLLAYVKRLRHSLADAGIPFDRRSFKPHITLFRNVTLREDGFTIPETIPAQDIWVRSVALMRSTQGKRGMIYTELGSIQAPDMTEDT